VLSGRPVAPDHIGISAAAPGKPPYPGAAIAASKGSGALGPWLMPSTRDRV